MQSQNDRSLKKITNRMLPTQLAALMKSLDDSGIYHKAGEDSEKSFIEVFPRTIPQRIQATNILRAQ